MPDLVGHDRQPSAFLVYLFLWRLAHGSGAETTQVALCDIAEGSGLSKRAVQGALGWLVKRRLVGVARESITAVPVYTVLRPWILLSLCAQDADSARGGALPDCGS
jgi:hypothetical protein